MKSILWNVFWLIALTVIAYISITKIQDSSKKCLQGVIRIEERLNSWELSE